MISNRFLVTIQKLPFNNLDVNQKLDLNPKMLPVQVKMARVALGLTVKQVAEVTGVSHDTITRIEAGEKLKPSTMAKVQAGLEAAGVQFIPENGGGAGVRLRDRM